MIELAFGAWWRTRRERRRWADEALVMAALGEQPDLSGVPIMRRTGLSPGRVHVALARLERDGRVTSRWADTPAPRRRLHRLTDTAAS